MLDEYREHIALSFPELFEKPFLIALSGGMDSVCLLQLCHALGLTFDLAHANFQLRGAESEEDEAFVRGLSTKLGRKLHIRSFDITEYQNSGNFSVQMAARDLRYRWFRDLISQKGYVAVLTAHHLEDNLETFLINLSRGTGIKGLCGIPARTESVMRPLLPYTKEQLLQYAITEGLEWRDDSSNIDPKYLRNKIRLELIPVMKTLHPSFLDNFRKTQFNLNGSQSLLSQYVDQLRQDLWSVRDEEIRISIAELSALEPQEPYLHALFSEYGFRELSNLADLLKAPSGKELFSDTYHLLKDRDHLILRPLRAVEERDYEISVEAVEIKQPLHLRIETVAAMGGTSDNILYADKETLNKWLTLRKWKKGDYFYPLGMKGRKKVSKFYKDEKLDRFAKEKQWLLCSGDEIVWVIGRRADDRFKVRKDTHNILKISLLT